MKRESWLGFVGVTVVTAGWLVSGQLQAQTVLSDGYTLEDFSLGTAGDLVDVCTLEQSHPDYVAAKAFCYGFFEGGIHYDEAVSTSPTYKKIVCDPPGTTRTEAAETFVSYVQANPHYASEKPIDAIFRALVAKWPCEE